MLFDGGADCFSLFRPHPHLSSFKDCSPFDTSSFPDHRSAMHRVFWREPSHSGSHIKDVLINPPLKTRILSTAVQYLARARTTVNQYMLISGAKLNLDFTLAQGGWKFGHSARCCAFECS